MKMISKVFSCMLAFSSLLGNVEGQNIYRIWYDKPASYWEEALPVGNGRIACSCNKYFHVSDISNFFLH